jgi:hypothetical protein
VAFPGALAVASDDPALLAEALRKRGGRSSPKRPIEARIEFEGSAALDGLRRAIGDSGLLPFLKLGSAQSLALSADVGESAVFLDAAFDGAEPSRAGPPPAALARFVPGGSSGFALSCGGLPEVYAWLKSLAARATGTSAGEKNLREMIKAFEEAGFEAQFLSRLDPGGALVLGSDEREGRVFPAFVLLQPSPDPAAAVQALAATIQRMAGSQAEARREMKPVGETEMHWWRIPALVYKDMFSPCYAAVPGALAFGNDPAFLESVIRTGAGRSGTLQESSGYRNVARRLGQYRLSMDSSPAGGLLFLPAFRQSLDGFLPHLAREIVYGLELDRKAVAEVNAELQTRDRPVPEQERVELCNRAVENVKEEKERLLRDSLGVLEALEWAALEATSGPQGVALRVAIELDTPKR